MAPGVLYFSLLLRLEIPLIFPNGPRCDHGLADMETGAARRQIRAQKQASAALL